MIIRRGTQEKTNCQWSSQDWKSRQVFCYKPYFVNFTSPWISRVSKSCSIGTRVGKYFAFDFQGQQISFRESSGGQVFYIGFLRSVGPWPIDTHVIYLPWIYKVGMFQLVIAQVNTYLPWISKVGRTQLVCAISPPSNYQESKTSKLRFQALILMLLSICVCLTRHIEINKNNTIQFSSNWCIA